MRIISLCIVLGFSLSHVSSIAWSQTRATLRLAPRAAARVYATQEAATAEEAAAVQPVPTPAPEDAAAASKPADDPKKAQEKQKRLQKIKQLSFDRRPSTILRVWNEYERELIEKEKAEKEKAEKEKAEKEAQEKAEKEQADKEKAVEDSESAESSEEAEAKTDEASTESEVKDAKAEDVEIEGTIDTENDGESESKAEESDEVADTEESKEGEAQKVEEVSDNNTKPAEDAKEEKDTEKKQESGSEKKGDDAKDEENKEEEKDKGPDFDQQLRDLQRDVTLSRWSQVKEFLGSLEEDEATAIYEQLLRSLASAPKNSPNPAANTPEAALQQAMQAQNQRGGQPEVHNISADDLIAIAGLAPKKLDEKLIRSLAGLVRVHLSNGYLIGDLTDVLKTEADKPEEGRPLTRQQAAELLAAAGHTLEAKDFLPTLEDAVADKNYSGLILLSEYNVALYHKDRKIEDLERAWTAVQEILAAPEVEQSHHEKALQRAVDLAPQVRDTLGSTWLTESFTGKPQRGIEILSTIGGLAASALQTKARVPNQRLEILKLQTTAVEALVDASPEMAAEWSDKLSVLAQVWIREAEVSYRYDTSTSRGPALQRDMYGNFFYFNAPRQQPNQNNRQPQPIAVDEILKTKPSDKWMKYVDEPLLPKISKVMAQLYLKVNEEDEAFPYIEQLATTHPAMAEDLVNEFLRVWTDNHDPNASRNRTNSYMYMYGFERRAESIPLTRSKQERNLKELAALVRRLNALPLKDVDQDLLVRAFTTCHSSAEVYRLEAIARVFGPLEDLEPKTLASLAQRMRTNLIGLWRAPATQKDAKTNRQQRDIMVEVMRGYQVALATVEGGLRKDRENWSLVLAKASLEHDANDYRRSIAPDSEFVARQEDAFAGFRRAAELYSKKVGDLSQNEENTKPFEVWYYASMGACDPNRIDQDKPKDAKQLPLIREAILALPGEAAERHMAAFANTLFTRLSNVKPALKYHYIESGLEIVGDHERAEEARKVFDYYSDLVTEIKLETEIDGSDRVGHEKPFGVFVNIVHTREIERESGGFRRYLQNQDQGNRYYYNYGRPLENYRDKFEEYVVSAVGDQFDVMSVTFQSEDVNSRSLPQYGWRYTPYAYVLLKAKGPEIDKLPPLQLDLDFLDTSGYAVIPVASPPLPIDASTSEVQPRPVAKLAVTQTLDERQAEEGRLILEVKATAQGLVPELEELVKLAPEGFDVKEIEDEGLSVSHFDPDSPENVVLSERTWLITMEAKQDLATPPSTFEFGEPLIDDMHEVVYQRYNDADLARVEQRIDLEERYAAADFSRWLWIAAGTVAVLLIGAGLLIALLSGRTKTAQKDEFAVPDRITPFTVLHLLDRIEQNNGLDSAGRQKLRESRNRIEQFYFDESEAAPPDLEEIAETFARQAKSRAMNGVS